VAKSILGDKIDHDESNKTINVCFLYSFEVYIYI